MPASWLPGRTWQLAQKDPPALVGPRQPGQVRASGVPGGFTRQELPSRKGFSAERVFLQLRGSSLASPSLQHPVERDKQTASAPLIYVLIGKRSGRGGVTLSRAQPALPLLTAQQRCLRTQIPPLSSPEAVKMYFLLCRFSFWQAGSQVGLETVKVGNKVVH